MEEFEKLCHNEYQTVRLFLMRLTGSTELADELTQETFCQAMESWTRFEGRCAPGTWLCGIAKRLYFQHCRKPPPMPVAEIREQPVDDLVAELADKERRMQAHRLLHSLPEPYREVMMLRTFGELSHAEIGALFGQRESWAKVVYFRARQMLNHMMKEEDKHE